MEVEEAAVLTMRRMQAAVDNCPERMDAADAEAPRIETAVGFCSGMQVVDTCPERMHAAGLTMRGFFWCSGKKKKQELKAAGTCVG